VFGTDGGKTIDQPTSKTQRTDWEKKTNKLGLGIRTTTTNCKAAAADKREEEETNKLGLLINKLRKQKSCCFAGFVFFFLVRPSICSSIIDKFIINGAQSAERERQKGRECGGKNRGIET
jgi:hypothetical protein